MAKNYASARHLIALQGGWVDLANSLNTSIGSPVVAKHLTARLEEYATLFATPDAAPAQPAKRTPVHYSTPQPTDA